MVLFPLNDGIGSVALVQHVGDDKGIVNAARVSLLAKTTMSRLVTVMQSL